jgi:hypothetical protein
VPIFSSASARLVVPITRPHRPFGCLVTNVGTCSIALSRNRLGLICTFGSAPSESPSGSTSLSLATSRPSFGGCHPRSTNSVGGSAGFCSASSSSERSAACGIDMEMNT